MSKDEKKKKRSVGKKIYRGRSSGGQAGKKFRMSGTGTKGGGYNNPFFRKNAQSGSVIRNNSK